MGHLGHAGRGGEAPYRTPPPDSGQASVNQATPARGGGAGSEPSAGGEAPPSPGPSAGVTDGSQVHGADGENASPDRLDVPGQPDQPDQPDHLDQPEQTDSGGAAGDSLDPASADDPLVRFLHELCQQHNRNQAAKRLGVDRKTLYRALLNGRLTPRLRDALERERAAAEREAAGTDQQELALRVEVLERRLQDVEQQQSGGLGSLHEELAGLRAQVRTLGWTRAGGAASGDAADAVEQGAGSHRIYPEVVSLEALPDDDQVLRGSFALVVEWREHRKAFEAHWPQVEGLEAEVRMLVLETALIDEHRLTLPPAQVPWEWWRRERELARRQERLGAARRALRRARWRRRLALHRQVRRAQRRALGALRHLRQARWRRLTGLVTARSALKRFRSMLWSLGQLARDRLTLLRR